VSRKRERRRTLLRALAGFVAGGLVWYGLAQPYHALLAWPAEKLIRLFETPAVTRLSASGGEVIVNREDFPDSSERPGLPAHDLDFNIAILTALFATARRPFSDRSMKATAIAALLLAAVHLAALIFKVESLYALDLGEWSRAHYGAVARNFWGGGTHFYRIAGMFAAPFALWWALAPDGPLDL
jgi:hypothetical protein